MKEKILVVHNKYRSLGGEDVAVLNEIKVLENSFIVEELIFDNNSGNPVEMFIYFLTNKNKKSANSLKDKIEKFQPDYVYVHNTWFKASVSIFEILEKFQIPTLIKLHNFRFYCTKTFFHKNHLNNQKVCRACGHTSNKYKLFNKYFEDSYLKSFLVIRHGKKFNKVLNNPFFNIVVLTNFQKLFMKNFGYNNKIRVLRNAIKPNIDKTPYNPNSDFIVYAGRISKEKGIEKLLISFLKYSNKNLKLKIVGDGPQKRELQKKYRNERIIFTGPMTNEESINIIRESLALITFTHLYEGQPTVGNEASMNSIPTVFPNNGGIHEFFPNNYELVFELGNEESIRNVFKLLDDTNLLIEISKQNYNFTNEKLAEKTWEQNFKTILNEV